MALMKKKTKKSAKKATVAKQVDEIDWEHLEKYGGLADLSVAELNLCLTERCGISDVLLGYCLLGLLNSRQNKTNFVFRLFSHN